MGSRKSKANRQKKNNRRASNPSKQQAFSLDRMGLAGIQQYLITCPEYGKDDPRNLGGPEGLPGEYKAVFVFSRPGYQLLPENRYEPAERLKGDSHFAIAEPAYKDPNFPYNGEIRLQAQASGDKLTFTLYPNVKGFLGRIAFGPFIAANFNDARLRAHRALGPILSNTSVYFDVPLSIYQMDVTELRTGSVSMSISESYREMPLFVKPSSSIDIEFLRYASLYREALNSNNSSYQFLCYCKLIEGIKKRRERHRREARDRDEKKQPLPKEKIPESGEDQISWLNSIFPVPQKWDDVVLDQVFLKPALGKKVFKIFDDKIRPVRNRIAHFILDSGELTVSIDEGEDIALVNEWLPITKCIARFLIKTEFPDAFCA
ncbi:MAG: methylamine utilization protein MauJ [Armatimonadota bacterium]